MKKIPIFGSGIKSISPNLTAQRRVNCFFEVLGDGEIQKIGVRGTPGLTLLITLPTFPIRGWCEAGTHLYVVASNVVYQVCRNGGYMVVGEIDSIAATPVGMAINETQVMIVDGQGGYVFNYALIEDMNPGQVDTLIIQANPLALICQATGNS